MARDRQRAKQRRNKRQAGAGGPSRAARARSARERRQPGDADWEETEAQAEPGAETDDATELDRDDAADSPGPLEHSSAAVDEARLAEAGVPPIDADEVDAPPLDDDEVDAPPIDADEVERAPDEVEGDLVPQRRGRHAAEEEDELAPARAQERTRSRGRVLTFLGHSWDELKRVQWPDRRQVGQGTAVTLGFVVLAGGYLGLLDAIWKPLIQAIL
jgi:preprotein translocase subunit SecE